MDYNRSTQARSWIFDKESLDECKRKSVDVGGWPSSPGPHPVALFGGTSPRKFASGYRRTFSSSKGQPTSPAPMTATSMPPSDHPMSSQITACEQEQLLRFHAHQLQTIVGPTAFLKELRTSQTVLSTATIFFRRFFLSNSVSEFHPRRIAAACAFFASKVEEEKIQVSRVQKS